MVARESIRKLMRFSVFVVDRMADYPSMYLKYPIHPYTHI